MKSRSLTVMLLQIEILIFKVSKKNFIEFMQISIHVLVMLFLLDVAKKYCLPYFQLQDNPLNKAYWLHYLEVPFTDVSNKYFYCISSIPTFYLEETT